ncbi:hypothetical protein HDU83_007787 [Entophlyctis luteolus]|nr:hypothetical protein HDU83_007787 [Entophlyctis luteolus]
MATALTEQEIKAEFIVDPTFQYVPNRHDWVERQFKNSRKAANATLPDGFPTEITGPSVRIVAASTLLTWLYELTEDDNTALKAALDNWKSLNLPLSKLNRTTFVLPDDFRAVTESWVDKLLHGVGFVQLRGFNIDDYSREDALIVYAGLASYVGDSRISNVRRGVFGHIYADESYQAVDIVSPAQEPVGQVYHTDAIPGGNIASFIAVGVAETGGDSQLASIGRVYNDIAKTRPDIIKTLSEDWVVDIGNYNGGKPGAHEKRPLLFHENGRIIAAIARRSVTGYGIWGRHKSLPAVTEEQKEALDTLHFLGAKHGFNIPLRRGDIQFLNNYEVFHAREGYTDSAENHRHLVRLWLRSNRIEWERSEFLKGAVEHVEEKEEVWNFEPLKSSS